MVRQERTPNGKGDRPSSADRSSEGTVPGTKGSALEEPGVTEVRTSDPNIVSPGPTSPPDRAVSYQTSPASGVAADYPFDSGGGSGVEEAGGNKRHRQEDDEREERKHKKHKAKHPHGERGGRDKHRVEEHRAEDKPRSSTTLPSWPVLLITGVLALACGIGGAWTYSAFAGSSSASHHDQGGKGGKGGKSGDKKEGSSQSDQGSDSEDLKKQVQQLSDGIDQLGTRIDQLNQSSQESRLPVPQFYPGTSRIEKMVPAEEGPPISRQQTQMTVLERKVEQMADLPKRVQELEERMHEMQEEIKLLPEPPAHD